MIAAAPVPATLIFQCPLSSVKERAISAVVEGWSGHPITHVSIMMDRDEVIEAVPSGVRTQTWPSFLHRLKKEGHQYVILGTPPSQALPQVSEALVWLRSQDSLPYNHTFLDSGTGWYCSQLAEAFYRRAGMSPGGLPTSPLNFLSPETQDLHPFWTSYYEDLGLQVPQGQPGSHPAMQSRASLLKMKILPLHETEIECL